MTLSNGGVLSGTPLNAGSFPVTITVKDSSAAPLMQQASFTLVVTQPTTVLAVSPPQLNFSYAQGDPNLPVGQSVGILSTPAGTPVSVSTSNGGTWLQSTVTLSAGNTPGTIAIGVNPANLTPNTYSGQVNISAPNATPSMVTVNVTLTVTGLPALLIVTPAVQSFALPQGGQSQGAVQVSNSGGGTLNYSSVATSDANWLTLTSGATGSVTHSAPTSISFTLNPGASLSPGLHSGQIKVTDLSTQNTVAANITLLVNGAQPSMHLSESGLTFFAVEGAGVTVPGQSVGVFNLGATTFSWSTQAQYLAANQSWLSVTPSGSASPASPGEAMLAVNPAGLAAGQYYATVNVLSTAANSPQSFSVLLNVVQGGQLGSQPQVSTGGIILAAEAGNGTAATQSITLFSPAGANLNYSTAVSTSGGGNWLTVTPAAGSLASGTATLTIQANAANVSAGVYYGAAQVAFSDGTVQTIQVVLVATAGPPGPINSTELSSIKPHASCTPTALATTFQSPLANAPLQVSVAQNVAVQITDNCGNPLLPTPTSSVSVYINGTTQLPPLSSSNSNGIWTGSWTPSSAQQNVELFASANQTGALGQGISGGSSVYVDILPPNLESAPQPMGTLNGASFDTSMPGLVVPGGYVSIYGSRLASTAAQGGTPLQTNLGGTQLLLGGQGLPLLFVTPSQVNGLIPQKLPVGTTVQLIVERGGTASVPVSAYVTDLQPGIFTTAQNGQGQGAILINGTGLIAGPAGTGQQPVSRGDYIQIYATGLGAVVGPAGSTPPADGQPAPSSPLFSTQAATSVTIGGENAAVAFSGLSPGFVALYQVNAQVPASAPVGSAVPLVITMTDSNGHSASSQTVTIAVQ
jgi:uncharacterized protein (TIGR03437 family)